MLPALPSEIFIEFISRVLPDEETSGRDCKKALSNLSLVSKFFHSISTPRLFESMVIEISSKVDRFSKSNYFYALDSGISRAKDLAPLVKTVSLSIGWQENNMLNSNDSSFVFLSAVQKLPNLETVNLSFVPISPTIVDWLTTLRKMRNLSFDYCWLSPDFEDGGASVLQTFTKVCQQTLKGFHLHPMSVAAGGHDPVMHKILAIRNPSPPLTRLLIHVLRVTEDMSLADILESFPALVDLTLTAISIPESAQIDTPGALLALPGTCVPNLARLKCPLAALPSFARHHLVKLRYLNVSEGYMQGGSTASFSASTLSSASLEELVLPAYTCAVPPFDVPLTRNLPRLHSLTIGGYIELKEGTYRGLLEQIATSCPSVKELRLSYGIEPEVQQVIRPTFSLAFDLQRQRGMISVLTNDGQLSGLTRVALHANFTWVRVQAVGEAKEFDWRPFIPSSVRSMKEFEDKVLQAVEDPRRFRDYKGWIGKTLAPQGTL